MTIERGRAWGRRVPRPPGVVEVADDAAASALVERRRAAGEPLPTLGLLGGDLRRTLGGGTTTAGLDSEVSEFTVDLGVVELDGQLRCFVSHLVARRSWWRGEIVVAMNAQFLGPWDVAPRGHPNDGRLEVLHVVELGPSDRFKAWRRLRSGTHVPHPGIPVRQVALLELELAGPTPVRLDGRAVGSISHLSLGLEPDALKVCV